MKSESRWHLMVYYYCTLVIIVCESLSVKTLNREVGGRDAAAFKSEQRSGERQKKLGDRVGDKGDKGKAEESG